jgi:hypothetical protein
MSRKIDITGHRFGKRVALKDVGRNSWGQVLWLVRCDCGRKDKVLSTVLKKTTKCRTCQVTRHGDTGSRLYNIWSDMRSRCFDVNQSMYKHYGGRGIKVCGEWSDYITFKLWALSNGYANNLTIDRINNDGNYEPNNCQWLTIQEQNKAGKKGTRCDNTSKITGVYYRKDTNKWFAGIGSGKKFIRSKCFRTKEEAVAARQELLNSISD